MIKAKSSKVILGKLNTVPALVPVLHMSSPACINSPVCVDGVCYSVTAASVTTAHGVVMVEDVNNVNVDDLGEKIGSHPIFPEGADIVFVQASENGIKARHYRKGLGEKGYTFEAACVAAAAAMMQQERLVSRLNVEIGGDIFSAEYDRATGEVSLSEPTELKETLNK